MKFVLIICAILFIISTGSMIKQRKKNPDAMIEKRSGAWLFMALLTLIPFIMLILVFSHLFNIKWYWSLIVSFIIFMLTSSILSSIYAAFLGIKTKPTLSIIQGRYIRYNFHMIDAVITLGLGLFLYFLFIHNNFSDGEYCAEIQYYNRNTGKHSTYTLPVEVENGKLVKIRWKNGGWLDESHFTAPDISDGTASFTSDKGYKYEVELKEKGSNCSSHYPTY